MRRKLEAMPGFSLFILLWVIFQTSLAFGPSPEEMEGRDRWINDNFKPVREVMATKAEEPELRAGLIVLCNHGLMVKNNRAGKPLKLGDVEFTRGLNCHAVSKVLVRLPRPGKTFTSIIGADNNSTNQNCSVSMVFSVDVGDKEAYKSEVIHGDEQPGAAVQVNLAGATEFTLNINDAEYGLYCDRGDWAEAKVILDDGQEMWLDELPVIVSAVQPLPDRLAERPPFSFIYDNQSSDQLLGSWKFQETIEEQGVNRIQRTQTYTDPKTGLEVSCVLIQYRDYPTVEWTLYLKNTSKFNTPILENIQGLDIRLQHDKNDAEFVLHHNNGSQVRATDYGLHDTVLKPGAEMVMGEGNMGRPTGPSLSCFNLESSPHEGLIIAVGWPGQLVTRFNRDENGVRICAGQELTHFTLLPGEEVRTPLIALQFWKGEDWLRAQNIWRRWFIAHNIRRPGGKLPPTQWAGGSAGLMDRNTTELAKLYLNAYLDRGLKPDVWWMDAGWYPCSGLWWNTGTWEVDKNRFPNGLREITDCLHENGIKGLLWFEPERAEANSWLRTHHPEWFFGGGKSTLLDLGNPEARHWILNRVDKLLVEEGIDIYRQDFNMDPLEYWRANDAPDRQGITEIRYVTGLLSYWDELLHRHPDKLYDHCAGGGTRNDLESMRRGVAYTKSDYATEPVGVQGQTYGISLWYPCYAASWGANDDAYICRSNMAHLVGALLDATNRNHFRDGKIVKRLDEWRKTVAHFWGDYWPLTPYSLDNNVWMAWQFDEPEKGEGVVQAFRRAENQEESQIFKLRGLDPDANYILTDLDDNQTRKYTGRELTENGLSLTAKEKPAALIITYAVEK